MRKTGSICCLPADAPHRFFETCGILCRAVPGAQSNGAPIQAVRGWKEELPIIGAFPMPLAKLKRGGPRNRRDRTSWQLSEQDCRKVIGAGEAAWAVGAPMSRFITLAWGKGGIEASEAVRATGDFIKLAREWMKAQGHPMPWVWVQERGNSFGQHAHVLLHVPAELEPLFRVMPRRWVKHILGGHYVAGLLDCQRIASAYSASINPAHYEAVLLGKVHYMLKTAPVALEGQLAMIGKGHKQWGQSCLVIGKRAAVWQGWKAQANG